MGNLYQPRRSHAAYVLLAADQPQDCCQPHYVMVRLTALAAVLQIAPWSWSGLDAA